MSFLSQLRQRQPDIQKGLQLCYALEVGENHRTLQLHLKLAELRQGKIAEWGKSYRLQRQHLQHPPPFMNSKDVICLTLLVDTAPDWLQQEVGSIPSQQNIELVEALLATDRCFLKTGQGQWQKLSLGKPVSTELTWEPHYGGSIALEWQIFRGELLLSLDDKACYPWIYDKRKGVLSAPEKPLTIEMTEALNEFSWVISPSEVGDFLRLNQEAWLRLGLPIPKAVASQACSARLTPVLRLKSESRPNNSGEIEDSVCLMYRYVSDAYCTSIYPDASADKLGFWDGGQFGRLIRDASQEGEFHQMLLPLMADFNAGLSAGKWHTSNSRAWKKLLIEKRVRLEQLGFQFWIDPAFRHYYVAADQWKLEIGETDNQILQLSLILELDGESVNLFELLRQLQAFNRDQSNRDTTLSLPDGRLLLLPTQYASGIMDELGDLIAKQGGTLQLPRSQMNRLASLNRQLPDNAQWIGAVEHLELSSSLHETPELLDKILEGVEAELRPYQWLGVCWLQHLKRHQVNGLLADDMGLGKTLQTLAHLSLERQQGDLKKPALIVAPTSLLHNWVAEIKRFTPQLKVRVVHGSNRQRVWGGLKRHDVLITSYQLIVNDLAHWQAQDLSWIILDEAHQIKNPRTQVSQALRQLESDYRLCLSGTPVQNHLGELWALLDFLMPGCLGSHADFKQQFQKPIELDANEGRMAQLQKRIAPFMLRRTKDQVAQDLPAKSEIYQRVTLHDDQQALYDEQKSSGQSDLKAQLSDGDNSGKQQILLLTALLKLRQVCCDPALLGVSNVRSAKREHCIEMVEELVEEGRSILLFSQFTSMLDLLAEDLAALKIPYLKLTGQSRNREQLVSSFQHGDAPVFLISLKAGGVGLNLTQADTVIHYDPWWNMAAEQQATDRAHRIGQDKPVFVYKLIAENTIEEKIAKLQQHKAQLSDHINHQAQISGEQFALKLEDLMALWQQETEVP